MKLHRVFLTFGFPATVALAALTTGCAWIPAPRAPLAVEPGPSDGASLMEETTLHPLFGDHAVLQRGMEIPIWGWDVPGELVVVRMGDVVRATLAGEEGRWEVRLPPMEAGGPHGISIRGSREIELEDILIGEVWLCSGQSNMEWPVDLSGEREEAVAAVGEGLAEVRYFRVPGRAAEQPRFTLDEEASWRHATPENVADFAAVPFWFANKVHNKTDLPIGIVEATWGGTSVLAWTSRESLLQNPAGREAVEGFDRQLADFKEALEEYTTAREEWVDLAIAVDPGNEGEEEGWHQPGHDDSQWETMEVPSYWETHGLDINGAVWFRTEVSLPEEWEGRKLHLHLGALDDHDVTYFNGVQVGETGRGTPQVWAHSREYTVPGGLVRPGRNVIATRIFDLFGAGGFGGGAEDMRLFPDGLSGEAREEQAIDLSGAWRYRVEYAVEPYTEPSPVAPQGPPPHWSPGYLFNGMINPIIPAAKRGVLWYQGESDTSWPGLFADIFPLLIDDWRHHWSRGNEPFYFVQLPPFEPGFSGDPGWAAIREAQLETWQRTPNTGMAIIMDVGDPDNVHPTVKRPVGERLARFALNRDHGLPMEVSGPVFRLMETEGSAIRLHFDHTTGGLATTGESESVTGFEVAGPDQIFHPAMGEIEGDTIVIMSGEVATPIAVRYGWANAPELNLVNGEGLPASPFRTDRWRDGDG